VLTISHDFESTTMAADIMAAYVGAVRDAGLPPRILLEAWQQGGRIPEDVDLDGLEADVNAGLAAAEKQKAIERAAQLEQKTPDLALVGQ
jgi:hypothetical protein